MPKINQEEYEILKEVRKDMDGRWHWLARDEKGYLWAYNVKPERKAALGSWGNPPIWSLVNSETLFQFIKWEDEEPYNISDLIEEYEREGKDKETDIYTRRMKYIAQAFSDLNSESEETEVKKDLEWAIKEIEGLETESSQNYPHDEMIEKEIVLGILNQLDEPEITLDKAFEKVAQSYLMTKEEIWRHLERLEAHGGKVTYGEPEVLSQEWIDEHITDGHNVNLGDKVVYVDELDGVLVPKQEEVKEGRVRLIVGFDGGTDSYYATDVEDALDFLTDYDARFTVNKEPSIPQSVAEFLIGKEDYTLYELFDDEWLYKEHDRVAKWLYDNDELTNKQREIDLVMARDRGYTVEEEQKYYVEDGKHTLLCKWESSDGWKVISTIESTEDDLPIEVLDYGLTEQEIKDYDERYWPFAVKVEELEE